MRDFGLHPEVVWVDRPDGSAQLLHLAGNTCSLDADAARLLRSIIAQNVGHATADLISRHGIGSTEARADVQEFVAALRKQQILRHHGPSRSEQLKKRAVSAIVRNVLRATDSGDRTLNQRARRLLFIARWATLQFGWSIALRAWEAAYPQPASGRTLDTALIAKIDEVVRGAAAHSLLKYECKERALACLALGRHAGIHTELVLGVAFMPTRAHVWVESEGRIFSDDPDHCRAFERIGLRSGPAPSPR